MEEVIHPVEEVIHTLVILESAQGPNPSFCLFIRLLFDLGACWDQDLDQGLTIKINIIMTHLASLPAVVLMAYM